MKFKHSAFVAAMVVCAGVVIGSRDLAPVAAQDSPKLGARVYELRTYYTHPGKMNDLHSRFRDHTNGLFVKHGMTVIGYWSPVDGENAENTLVYLLAHADRDAAKKSWTDFAADPDWKKVAAESEVNGKLVAKVESRFLNPTDYSPLR